MRYEMCIMFCNIDKGELGVMNNKIQLILIIVVGLLVVTNIFTFTQVTALEKDLNAKVEDIDTEIALQSKSIQFVQTDLGLIQTDLGLIQPEIELIKTDLGYLEKHMHWTAYQRIVPDGRKGTTFLPDPRDGFGIKHSAEKISEWFCSTNLYPENIPSGGKAGEMLIIRDQDEKVSWHTAKCE